MLGVFGFVPHLLHNLPWLCLKDTTLALEIGDDVNIPAFLEAARWIVHLSDNGVRASNRGQMQGQMDTMVRIMGQS